MTEENPTPTPTVDKTVANAIAQSEKNNNHCQISSGVVIRCDTPQIEAIVLRPFSIQLLPEEGGFIAISNISTIYEPGATRSDAVHNYLYSLVDELIWLEEEKENLAGTILDEFHQINIHISRSC